MVSEKDLIVLMKARRKLWSPSELCDALGMHVCELISLIKRAQVKGAPLKHVNSAETAYTSKFWLIEG
ncbi:hypothetical protein FKN90_04230 [Vibrio sp. 2017_1457_15]|nr:hypothetical protein [Vibrio sp. 2017_1457_15]MDQ2160434.1 hypothetical protein [Vibrio sp. 2017_1457_13]NNN44745.1 hypothetical protein [Vibrio sp. 1-1(7)]NNN72118.1 hypothetical protein [Vibrio sp. 12-2(3-a)]